MDTASVSSGNWWMSERNGSAQLAVKDFIKATRFALVAGTSMPLESAHETIS
jgi:hypothetical protein